MPIVWHQINRHAIGQVFTTQGFGRLMAISKRYAGNIFKKSRFPATTAKVGLMATKFLVGKMIARKSRIFRGTDILVTFHPHANQEISIHQILQGKRSEVSLATTI
jgi:hypothetical protein